LTWHIAKHSFRNMTNAEKVTENRLRRIAKRRGHELIKSRTRDPKALSYGKWDITNTDCTDFVREGITLAEVEEFFK
jgi:hypothetical protein